MPRLGDRDDAQPVVRLTCACSVPCRAHHKKGRSSRTGLNVVTDDSLSELVAQLREVEPADRIVRVDVVGLIGLGVR